MKRTERKFVISNPQLYLIYNKLLDYGFREIYPERKVTSIYYDTLSLSLFQLAEEGISERKKIRVRFYNENVNDAFLEYKFKKGELGWKQAIEINKFESLKKIQSNQFPLMRIPSSVEAIYHPVIGIEYKRLYFLSECGDERITLDSSLKLGRVISNGRKYRTDVSILTNINVLEVKADYGMNKSKIKKSNLIEENNLTLSKFSKYCYGIMALY